MYGYCHFMSLTPKQKKFIEFIQTFTQENGYAPSNQEIANHFGFKSKGTVQDYLVRLREQGYLQTDPHGNRNIALQQTGNHLPLLGQVAAGQPLEAFLEHEFIEVPSSFLKPSHDHYVLQVQGDSMVDDGILDGDYVIIRQQASAANGQTVIASINGASTLKKLYKTKTKIELRPANRNYDSLILKSSKDFEIKGVLTGILRNLN